ncbi:MAG: DUF983 domain-containing protein [Pirellulales bacterium]
MTNGAVAATSLPTAIWRAVRLRCPVCGRGRLFRNWISMHPTCSHCGLKYERAAGYFLGSIYFNYGLTTLIVIVAYLVLFFTDALSQHQALAALLAFSVLFPLFFFRWARSLWMAFDHYVDPKSGGDNGSGDERS